jgi:tRNA pseudouridine55 synthase
VNCGSGTYIRSLGRDLAETLGTSSVMEALTRTAIGPFHLSAAVSVEQIEQEGTTPFLLPAHFALHPRPELTLTETEQIDLLHGRPIQDRWHAPGDELVALSPSHELVAILERRNAQTLWPSKTFR